MDKTSCNLKAIFKIGNKETIYEDINEYYWEESCITLYSNTQKKNEHTRQNIF